MAKTFLDSRKHYLSWDDLADRELIRKHQLPFSTSPLVIDEIHKYPRWRTLLKGLYDKSDPRVRVIVTGSARLDHFRKGGDSLFGRYHYFRMHPLSVSEVGTGAKSVERLLRFGGFPEPFIKQSDTFSKIWQRERVARVIREYLRDSPCKCVTRFF